MEDGMSTEAIYKDMIYFADVDNWPAHMEAGTRLLETRASTLSEAAPKLRFLAKMMGNRDADDIEGRILRSLMQDAGIT